MEQVSDTLFNNRYRLIERKGSGSFGEVWLARDGQLDMDVAVKIYIALDDRGIEEFKKEYKTAYNLNHPNLLHAYHFDVCERRPFLVMPYCPKSATSLIGCCDNDTLWRFIKDVSSGLSYLHSLDIVHHDIKPDNILITEDGRFVITDFGISTKMRSTLRRNSTRAAGQNSSGGSLPYMGPEMFTGKPESVKATDIWALGATLYEMITGELPFFGQGGVMMLNGAAVPEIDFPDNDIVSLVRSCLSKNTWDRPIADNIVMVADSVIKGCFSEQLSSGGEKRNADIYLTVNSADSEVKTTIPSSGAIVDYKVATNAEKYKIGYLPSWCVLVNKDATCFTMQIKPNQGADRSDWFEVHTHNRKVRVLLCQDGAKNDGDTSSMIAVINKLQEAGEYKEAYNKCLECIRTHTDKDFAEKKIQELLPLLKREARRGNSIEIILIVLGAIITLVFSMIIGLS